VLFHRFRRTLVYEQRTHNMPHIQSP
jgi:hypothetical protein